MIQLVCALYDIKGGVYSKPFVEINSHTAERAFRDALAAGNTAISNHPQDYVLYQLGTFDDNEGTFVNDLQQIRQGVEVLRELEIQENEDQRTPPPITDEPQVLRST